MPVDGYRVITLREEIYNILKELSNRIGSSMSDIVSEAILQIIEPEELKISEARRKLSVFEIAAFFHGVLFAYQKIIREVLGDVSSSVIANQTMPLIERILGKSSPQLMKIKDVDEALEMFAKMLTDSGFVKEAKLERKNERRSLNVKGCIFAEHVHSMLDLKDVTCPYGIFAFSIAQKAGKRKVRLGLSDFTINGSKTTIEFL